MKNPDYKTARFRVVRRLLLTLVGIMILLTTALAFPRAKNRVQDWLVNPAAAEAGYPAAINVPSNTNSPPAADHSSETPPAVASDPSATPTATIPSNSAQPQFLSQSQDGLAVVAIHEDGYSHLFVYRPGETPFTRLTANAWDDTTPAVSPDGTRIAYASDRDGDWDLYILDLEDGNASQLTNSPAYDSNPTWSPDGLWIGYETYSPDSGLGLEVNIVPANGEEEPLALTNDPASDYSPAWSPQGRKLAFISNRDGKNEVWIADLDLIEGRFRNLNTYTAVSESHPSWSPDGSRLAFASQSVDGIQNIYIIDVNQAEPRPQYVGAGDWTAWSPDGRTLLASLRTPNKTYLTAYDTYQTGLAMPPLALSGSLDGISWSRGAQAIPPHPDLVAAAQVTQTPLWQARITPADIPNGRRLVVPLNDVKAPNAGMNDRADEAFPPLRDRVGATTGWDFLANLENAFVPLTVPVGPGQLEDWLQTGRAFSVSPAAMNAGWMVAVREDFGAHTYWRLYLRARFQDGSQGRPLHNLPWDFSLRYGGDPRFYEQGGGPAPIMPEGFWIDFTDLALAYGWERVPALTTWRSAFHTSRFNQYILSDGLDWLTSMLEIYPAEALATPTPLPSPTPTLAPHLRPTRTPAPTKTPTVTRTSRPTRTPTVTRTPRKPTATSQPSGG